MQKPRDCATEYRQLRLTPIRAGISIVDAVHRTAIDLGVSFAAAKLKLIEACVAGLIRACWRGCDWTGADVDVRHDVMILANGERRALIDLDRKEFEAWLSGQVNSEPAALIVEQDQIEARPKKFGKTYPRTRAEQALAALFNGKIPPVEVLPGPALSAQVNEWIKADCKKRQLKFVAISDDTIKRAAGRRE